MQEENKFSYRSLVHGKDDKWHFALGLNDVTTAGSYAVRLFHNDLTSLGISTDECDNEHYTFAHLFVSESAATGKQQAMRTIGQTLFLTLCTTNDVKILTRTCEVTPQGAVWSEWANAGAVAQELPTAQELNTIAGSLDNKFIYRGSGDVDVVSGGYFERTATDVMLNLKKWGDITGSKCVRHSISAATENLAGVMSASDKVKLNKTDVSTKVQWGAKSNVNNYTTAGIYILTGERLNAADGLPITNCNPGHTINARLMVLDSSISGTNDSQDKCVTQLLIISNRTGCDGDVYMRTGCAASKELLAGGHGWEQWGKLQQNIEVGQVGSLDEFTENGIYSGIYTNGITFFETFVMVVINNYVIATSTGQTRCISQFKYALDIDSEFSYKTRTARGDDDLDWGSWVNLGAATTTDIQDGAITAQKLSSDVREKVEKVPSMEENAAKEKTALVNGDTIVGLAREVYSRQGKVDNATFLKRTTAGGTSVSDGVATLKQIGGNIIKNIVDGVSYDNITTTGYIKDIDRGILTTKDTTASMVLWGDESIPYIPNHYYYCRASIYNKNAKDVLVAIKADGTGKTTSVTNQWVNVSMRQLVTLSETNVIYKPFITVSYGTGTTVHIKDWTLIDLTEMYGVGKEPTNEECDKLFGTMDALPRGLTIAQPTGLKSIGYNLWNPKNIIVEKNVVDNAIADNEGTSIAIFECLPCKTGTGENNGYVIGYGEGDTWSDDGIEVYLTPLNPLEVEGELYMHKLEKDETYGTYVPQIKGYLLVVTPTTQNFCAHFLWSGDREKTDYEEFIESDVALPPIPEMSEWGLAGITMNGAMVHDTIDLENGKYTKRIGAVDMGTLKWQLTSGESFYAKITGKGGLNVFSSKYTSTEPFYDTFNTIEKTICTNLNDYASILVKDSSYDDADSFKQAMQGVMLYYVLATPEEYPIVTKTAPNYVGSDYGVEEFAGSKVPLVANILFYMRSLVSETRNFLDRLMAGLGTSDATAVADKIIAAIASDETGSETTELQETVD